MAFAGTRRPHHQKASGNRSRQGIVGKHRMMGAQPNVTHKGLGYLISQDPILMLEPALPLVF